MYNRVGSSKLMCGERGRIPRRASWKFACGGLKEAEVRSELEEQTALALERTGWALQLNQEIEDRTARELQFSEELERLSWARALDRRFHRPLSSGFRMAGYVRDRIRQVLSGKSWL